MEMFDATVDFKTLVSFVVGRGHCNHLGMELVDHGDSWCTLKLPYSDHVIGDPLTGIVASGPIVALMDMAAGMSIFAACKTYAPHVTLDLRVDYPRPAQPGSAVYGRAECYRMTKSVAFVRGVAHDGDPDNPVAHIAGTFMFVDAA
jgi:uncharacterized protein (TIGR00369 family)